jgi:serine phosphatase RsbU (regulator of sigma subunit)
MRPKKVKYQYKLEGIDENWSAITSKTEATYGNLPHGFYTFKVKAMNSDGFWSNESDYSFVILPPWWQTLWFKTLVVLLIVGSIWFYIKWRERKLKKEKEILEQTVAERTSEVVEEKKIVIEKNILVEAQKQLIEEKHKEITDSINYAERIQRSFIATKEILNENLKNYFVFFKPKDTVSGDFYWASKLNNGNFALATADSTGHGVPGAIMSLLNVTSLEKAIETETKPSNILNVTRKIIIERLKKDGSDEGGKDGMDASLTVYDFKNMKLIIAAANNPVWIMRGTEIIEIKPDKMPVGKHYKDDVSFTQQEVTLQAGDVVYTLTDGFPDQFGGVKGKKFMIKNLRNLLAANHQLSMQEQKDLLEETFTKWVGNLEQVDDVTIIGVRV